MIILLTFLAPIMQRQETVSLSKKIAEMRDAQLMADAVNQLKQDRAKKKAVEQRIEIVTNALIIVAQSLEEGCEPLGEGLDLPKYYRFGDFIVVTQLFETVGLDNLESPEKPAKVLAQYFVALVGIDKRTGSLETRRIGMLRWLNFESIFKAVTTAPTYLDFDPEKVLEKLAKQ